MQDLALQVGLVHEVVVHDPDPAAPGRGQVERSGRAEAARADDQHLRGEELLLTRDPDFGDQDVTAVALALGVVEAARMLDRKPGLCPADDATCERENAITVFREGFRRAQRPVPVRAVEEDRLLAMGGEPLGEGTHRDVQGAGEPARLELPFLADVDEERWIVAAQQLLSARGVDFEGKRAVTRHAPRIIRTT